MARVRRFNGGQAYHGSDAITQGKLKGATHTDYFHFFCSRCPGQEVLRILEYGNHGENRQEELDDRVLGLNKLSKSKAHYGFILVFKIHCERCNLTDFVKIGNIGFSGGQHETILNR